MKLGCNFGHENLCLEGFEYLAKLIDEYHPIE